MTALMAGVLGFVAKIHPAREPDEEYLADPEDYQPTHRDIVMDPRRVPDIQDVVDQPGEFEDYDEGGGEIVRHYYEQSGDFINQQSWRLLMRSYVAVAETCSPPGSFRKVQASMGWHPREQRIFRDMLIGAGLAVVDAGGTLAWTSTKAQRRTWLANATFPSTPPPVQKAPCPTENPSPEVLEHPENPGTPENTEES